MQFPTRTSSLPAISCFAAHILIILSKPKKLSMQQTKRQDTLLVSAALAITKLVSVFERCSKCKEQATLIDLHGSEQI
jgi:hypothetical protein